ncbi:MAG: GNAT family N-acetyltransferase [Gemmatimonadota bacterium]
MTWTSTRRSRPGSPASTCTQGTGTGGIASALVGEIERIAAAEGVGTLWLWTPDRARLYARLGWTTVACEPYRGVEAKIMRKELT